MLSEVILSLRLIDRANNRDRIYLIEIDDDLFGAAIVTITHGRAGSWSQSQRITVSNRADALVEVAKRLRRRASARRRLGSSYALISSEGDPVLRRRCISIWQKLGGAHGLPRQFNAATPETSGGKAMVPELPLFAA